MNTGSNLPEPEYNWQAKITQTGSTSKVFHS